LNNRIEENTAFALNLKIKYKPVVNISIISLDPPPLSIDKTIYNLKRIEIRIPIWKVKNGKTTLKVRLAGE
jgi:hypothetical protein